MATTATISIASDIMSSFGGITETMTLTQAGTTTDIDSTTGFQIRKLAATSTVDLVTMANELVEPEDSQAAKIYIRNIGYRGVTDKSVGVTIGVKSEPIGKLYIKNHSTDETYYISIVLDAQAVGRLYGGPNDSGDWMFIPADFHDANADIEITATGGTNKICYALFHEGTTLVAS